MRINLKQLSKTRPSRYSGCLNSNYRYNELLRSPDSDQPADRYNGIEFRRVKQIRKNCGCLNDVLTTTLMEVVSVGSSKTVSSFCFSGDIRVMDINSEGRLVLVKERHYVGTFPEVDDRYKRVLSARQVEVPRRRQLQISDAVGLKQRRS